MVYYRKYRPQTIEDLDSTHIREALIPVLSKPIKDIPHAYLFTGPKGLGKTSTARIIAKVVNCERRQLTVNNSQLAKGKKKSIVKGQMSNVNSIEPCNKCEQCLSIMDGTNMDVLEIDAASNRGIDEIRDLREKIRLFPLSARVKVYIIDEVHMLTTEAFNALLKTLEEPPLHAMFILCTTEPQKVPGTILSRCFHISFRPATENELTRSLKRIVKAEKISIADDAIQYIANLADRSFRDGVKILEEVTSSAQGKKITKELVESQYKTNNMALNVQDFLVSINNKNVKENLMLLKKVTDQGTDIKYFTSLVMDTLHEILLLRVGISDENKNLLSGYTFTIEDLKKLVELFSKAYSDMKYAVLPQLPLELAVIEWSMINTDKSTDTPGDLDQDKSASKSANINAPKKGVSILTLRQQVGTITKIKALYGSAKQNPSKDTSQKTEHTVTELLHSSSNGEITKEWQDTLWKHIIAEMKNHNHTIAGVLRSCRIKTYDRKKLIIETAYKFHKERLDDKKTQEALYKICKLLTGKEVEIKVELKGKPA